MSAKKCGSLVLIIVAIGLASVAMGIRYWIYHSETDSHGQEISMFIGIKTMEITVHGPTTNYEWSGTFDAAVHAVPPVLPNQATADQFNKAGNYVLGFGGGALLCLAISFILSSCAHRDACSSSLTNMRTLSCLLLIVSAGLMAAGFILWSKEFNVGYSFTLSIVAAFISLAGSFLLGSSLVGRTPSKSQQSLGLFIQIAALALLLASLITNYWYVLEGDSGGYHVVKAYGLKTWYWSVKSSSTGIEQTFSGTLADGPGSALPDGPAKQREIDNMHELDKTGTKVMIAAAIGGLLVLLSFILSALYVCGKSSSHQIWGVVSGVLAGGVIMVGVFLYAHKLFISASYIMFVASSFLCIVALVVLISSYSDDRYPYGDSSYHQSLNHLEGIPNTDYA